MGKRRWTGRRSSSSNSSEGDTPSYERDDIIVVDDEKDPIQLKLLITRRIGFSLIALGLLGILTILLLYALDIGTYNLFIVLASQFFVLLLGATISLGIPELIYWIENRVFYKNIKKHEKEWPNENSRVALGTKDLFKSPTILSKFILLDRILKRSPILLDVYLSIPKEHIEQSVTIIITLDYLFEDFSNKSLDRVVETLKLEDKVKKLNIKSVEKGSVKIIIETTEDDLASIILGFLDGKLSKLPITAIETITKKEDLKTKKINFFKEVSSDFSQGMEKLETEIIMFDDNDIIIDFYLCKSRFHSLTDQFNNGMIDYPVFDIAFNKILKSVFSIINKVYA